MSIITCPECKLVNWASEVCCKRCAFVFQPLGQGAEPSAQGEATTQTAEFEVPEPVVDTGAFPPRNPERSRTLRPEPTYRDQQSQRAKPKIALAIFSMIAGIVGMPPLSSIIMVIVGGVLAIFFGGGGFIAGVLLVCAVMPIGLISGIVALRRANRSVEYGGKGFAIAGIACSSIACVVLPLVAAIAIPNLLASRRAANEGAAVSTIRRLASAEEIFMKDLGSGHCGDFDVLEGVSLIEKTLVKSEKSGYRFIILNHPRGGCEIHATPISASTGNRAFFYMTSENVIRATTEKGRQAGNDDPPIQDPFSQNDDLPAKIALQKSR